MSPRRTTEADSHGTRRAARAAKLASIGQTASPRGMKFARRPDEKRTATHTDRPTPAHKPGGLRTQTIFASCVRISASSVYKYSLSTGPGNFTSHPRRLCPALRRFSPPGRGRRGQKWHSQSRRKIKNRCASWTHPYICRRYIAGLT